VPLLEIIGLSMSFFGLRALADVSFDVHAGEIVGMIGPNGAGKSTLLNCVSRLYRPERGTIYFEGEDLVNRTAYEVAAMGIRRTFHQSSSRALSPVGRSCCCSTSPRLG
jgi:branched-chain amino acid transport system ATP-binding protein